MATEKRLFHFETYPKPIFVPYRTSGSFEALLQRRECNSLPSVSEVFPGSRNMSTSTLSRKVSCEPSIRIAELARPNFPFFTLVGKNEFQFIRRTKKIPACESKKLEMVIRSILPPLRQVELARPTAVSFPDTPDILDKKVRIIIFPPKKRKIPKPCSKRVCALGTPLQNWMDIRKRQLEEVHKMYAVPKAALHAKTTERIKQLAKPKPSPIIKYNITESIPKVTLKAVPTSHIAQLATPKYLAAPQKLSPLPKVKKETSVQPKKKKMRKERKKEISKEPKSKQISEERKEIAEWPTKKKETSKQPISLANIIAKHNLIPPPAIDSAFQRTVSYILLPEISQQALRNLERIEQERINEESVKEEIETKKEIEVAKDVASPFPPSMPRLQQRRMSYVAPQPSSEMMKSFHTLDSSEPKITIKEDEVVGKDEISAYFAIKEEERESTVRQLDSTDTSEAESTPDKTDTVVTDNKNSLQN